MTHSFVLDPKLLDIVGIVGSRGPDPERGRPTGWTNATLISRIIRRILDLNPQATIVSGGAPSGVDHDVAMVCRFLRLCDGKHFDVDPTSVDCPEPHFYEFLAQWTRPDGSKDKGAGFRRNEKLVRHCSLVLALFAPGPMTPGTSHVVEFARGARVPVMVYYEGVWS